MNAEKQSAKAKMVHDAFVVRVTETYDKVPEAFYAPTEHRTYNWYLMALLGKLEERCRYRKPGLSSASAEAVRASAQGVMASIRVLHTDRGLAAKPNTVLKVIEEMTPTRLAFERLVYYLIAELKRHLKSALQADDGLRGSIEGVRTKPRRAARSREQLPDPDQPAWATMNRPPAKRVQIPCRIDPAIKKLIEKNADDNGVTQSRWLEEAIAEKLQRQGYAVELPKAGKPPVKKVRKPRRPQRPSIPEPDKSPNATVNRADKPTTVRVSKAMMREIDKVRGRKNRSRWMNEAITAFLESDDALPPTPDALEVLSEPIGLRFDKNFFPEIEAAAEKSNETKSEWFRRVARWYLTVQK